VHLAKSTIKTHYKAGNIFVGFFWQPGAKGFLELPGFEIRTLRFPAWPDWKFSLKIWRMPGMCANYTTNVMNLLHIRNVSFCDLSSPVGRGGWVVFKTTFLIEWENVNDRSVRPLTDLLIRSGRVNCIHPCLILFAFASIEKADFSLHGKVNHFPRGMIQLQV